MVTPVAEKEHQLNIEAVTWGKLTWANIEKPSAREMQYLEEHYPFHPLDLEDCLSRIELPKIDEYEDYLFIVCHFPVFNKQTGVPTPSQVSIFIGEDYVITIHAGDLKPLARLFRDCHAHERARQENL